MENLDYFKVSWISNDIAQELGSLKDKKTHMPNLFIINDALKIIKDMQSVFVHDEKSIGKINEKVFYDELFFGEVQFYEGPTGRIPDYGQMEEYARGKINSQNLIKTRVDSTARTIDKILSGKRPTKKELPCAKDLFDYIATESFSKIKRGPYGQLLDNFTMLQGLAA